jgi:septal ring factor EnvC (AmiA/AmiB activator)
MTELKVTIVCVLIVFSLQVPLNSQDSELTRSQAELSGIRERLHQCRQRKEQIEKEEKTTLGRLEIVSEELNITKELIEALQIEEGSLKKEVAILEKKVDRVEADLQTRKSILAKRLREIYKQGRVHDLELILLSRSLSDVFKKVKYILLIAEQDRKLMDSTRVLAQTLNEERQKLTQKAAEERELREEKENEENAMKKEKRAKEEMLQALRKEGKEKERLEKELEEAERRVIELIQRLERQRVKSGDAFEGTDFERKKGILRWPVEGKVISSFGKKRHPVYWTVTQNNGIDIEASHGEPVHAVARGKVVYADRFLGYSKVVLLDHGEGYYTLYAYLSEILAPTGTIVGEGDIIAYVGDSLDGSLFHFEVRRKGKPENPLNWLSPR